MIMLANVAEASGELMQCHQSMRHVGTLHESDMDFSEAPVSNVAFAPGSGRCCFSIALER